MLTRNLVRFSVRSKKARPTFVRSDDPKLLESAESMVAVASEGVGQPRGEVEEQLGSIARDVRPPKLGKGLVKLVTDRLESEEPGGAVAEERRRLFAQSAERLRALGDGATMGEFEAALAADLGADELEKAREGLYADLPSERRVLAFDALSASALLDRYNLALVQGLVMYTQRLEIFAPATDARDVRHVRRLMRWLKFCRLVASIQRESDGFRLDVEGPGRVIHMSKRYGLQMAQFVSALPILERWQMRAEVRWPRRAAFEVELNDTAPLCSPHARALGYVPEEIRAGINRLGREVTAEGWGLDTEPEPLHVGPRSVSVPDFELSRGPSTIAVELFHRWHRGPLVQRLSDLDSGISTPLVLGVDRSLAKDGELAQRLTDDPRVFVFGKYPTWRNLRPALGAWT